MTLTNQAPANNSVDVRRDWSLTVDVTDAAGIDSGTVVLSVNGSTVTPTVTSITDGYRVEYIPASASSYSERITATISADVTGGITETSTWRFTITAGAISATAAAPPNVVVLRDISLAINEADETIDTVNVVWLDSITHPLIVTEEQAEAVGTVQVDGNTYHRHRRTILVDATDANSDAVAELQEGDLIAFTASALSETAQKAVVLAIKQQITQAEGVQYNILIEYYEAV